MQLRISGWIDNSVKSGYTNNNLRSLRNGGMTLIYTVTVNPSVDYVVQLGEFHLGMVNRALNEAVFSGGKGINVAMILQNLGVSNRALGFLAGFTGDFIEKDLRRRGCRTDFVRLEKGFSRINVKLKGQEGSEINGSGPAVDQAAVQALFEKISTLQKGDILIISGSVPLSLPQDFYERILDLLKGREIDTVVDATGEALLKTLRYEPFLIKPNLQELEELAERRLFTREKSLTGKTPAGDGGEKCADFSGGGGGNPSDGGGGDFIRRSPERKASQCCWSGGLYGGRLCGRDG